MEEIPYHIVPFKIERKTWQQVFDHVSWNKHVPEVLKPAWYKGLQYMRKEFGEEFLAKCERFHPIDHLVGMGSDAEVRYLLNWINTYQELKTTARFFPALRGKLISNRTCRPEGMPFMDIAGRFMKARFSVDFPKEIATQFNPDISLVHQVTGDAFFIEVSRIGETEQRDKEFKQYTKLLNAVDRIGYYLPSSGQMKGLLSDDAYQHTLIVIAKLKDKCWQSKSMVTYEDENIAIAFSTDSSFADLEKWSEDNGYTRGLQGPRVHFNDIDRIIRQKRIEREARQIPIDSSGLLYFPVQAMFLLFTNAADIIIQIGPQLFPHPNILGLVFYSDMGNTLKPSTIIDDENFIYTVNTEGPYARETIYIQNPYYSGDLSYQTIDAIRNAVK